jgi:hypothetical protein
VQRHAYFRLIQQYDQIAEVLMGHHPAGVG